MILNVKKDEKNIYFYFLTISLGFAIYSTKMMIKNFTFHLYGKVLLRISSKREELPGLLLDDLCNKLTMPPALRKAHQANDFAVMAVYGFDKKITESKYVAEFIKIYQKLTKNK